MTFTRYAELSGNTVTTVINSETDPGGDWVACGDAAPGWTYDAENETFSEPEPISIVPREITMRQARRALHQAGLLTSVEAAIQALPDPQKTDAVIEWEYSSTVQRHNGFVSDLAPILGLSDAQLDDLFIAGSLL